MVRHFALSAHDSSPYLFFFFLLLRFFRTRANHAPSRECNFTQRIGARRRDREDRCEPVYFLARGERNAISVERTCTRGGRTPPRLGVFGLRRHIGASPRCCQEERRHSRGTGFRDAAQSREGSHARDRVRGDEACGFHSCGCSRAAVPSTAYVPRPHVIRFTCLPPRCFQSLLCRGTMWLKEVERARGRPWKGEVTPTPPAVSVNDLLMSVGYCVAASRENRDCIHDRLPAPRYARFAGDAL